MSSFLPNAPIAARILKALRAQQSAKVIDFSAFKRGREQAEMLDQSMVTPTELEGFYPGHAMYIVAQNWASIMMETLTAMEEAAKFAALIGAADEAYMPQGPPMSPITTSCFSMWAAFDAAVGLRNETLGSIILHLGQHLGVDGTTLRLVGAMQDSAMRVYSAISVDMDVVRLLDILSGQELDAYCSAGRRIQQRELWLVRVLPPARDGELAIAMTTPYVLQNADAPAWRAYFQCALGAAAATPAKTQAALKFRIDWLEYIFAAYASHSDSEVYLTGIPDQPASLPHYSDCHPLARFGRGPKKK